MSRVIEAFAQFFDGDGTPLANGWLLFLETKTNNTYKSTYADANLTIANANPLQLDAEGRCPNVFGQGVYRVVLYTHNPVTGLPGELIAAFDPVQSEYLNAGASGNFVDWDTETTYDTSQIVIYEGNYYRSIQAANYGKVPDINPDYWEQIDFIRFWNTNVTYSFDDIVVYSSNLYFSLADSNQGNTPISSPLWWEPVGSGTVLLNWEESGTAFQPDTAGYDLGAPGNEIGTAYITDFGTFPLTPSSDPANDYDVANKAYVDSIGTGRMRWMGKWSAGSYVVNDVVRDGQWTMVCVADTDDRAAPQPIGDPMWVREAFSPPDFTETTLSDSVLYIGQRYTFSPSFLVEGIRLWLPETLLNIDVEVFAVVDPTGVGNITELLSTTTIDETMVEKWLDVPIDEVYIADGVVIDLIMVFKVPSEEVTFTYEWNYIRANGDPSSGEIYHQSGGNIDQIRVHEEDTGAIDRTSYLDNIGPGSTISMADTDFVWEVLSASKTGVVYTFIVYPAVRAGAMTSNFTFAYFAASDIPYVFNTDLFVSDSRIEGYFASEYDPSETTYFNSTGYGIDIRVRNVSSSSAWEIVSQPSRSTVIGEGGDSGELYYWEEVGEYLRPITDEIGYLGDVSNTIYGIYLSDGSEINSAGAMSFSTPATFDLTFSVGGSDKWLINSNGHFLPGLSNTYNIGSTTAEVLNIYQGDNGIHYFGSDQDMTIYHDGSTGYLHNTTGNLWLITSGSNSIYFSTASTIRWLFDTSGHLVPYSAATYNIGSTVAEVLNIYQGDNGTHYFGSDQDMMILHDGSTGYMHNTTGNLWFIASSAVYFSTATTIRWLFDTSGHLVPYSDLTYNIGSVLNCVKNIYYYILSVCSDERYKKDIDDSLGLDFILEINPISYRYNFDDSAKTKKRQGVSAQEVEVVCKKHNFDFESVQYSEEHDKYSMDYMQFIAPLIRAVQELNTKIENL